MSNYRIKTIVVDSNNSPLVIKNGNINITNTNSSDNVLTGAFILNGGMGINCSYDSTSSNNGGALSIGGGVSINKRLYVGGDITLDNSSSKFNINGISIKRLFLDDVSNKNFYISPDGVSKRFDLYDTTLLINMTSESINSSTGALVINGGISINSTFDVINASHGGALTVGGGVSISGNLSILKTTTTGGLIVNSQIRINNINGNDYSNININSTGNLYIESNNSINFNASSGSFIFSNGNDMLLNISSNNNVFSKYISIIDTIESLNSTTGSIIISGGLSVNCTTDSSSVTNGGALTINGGASILKKVYLGDSIGIELSNNSKNNKIVLYQSNKDLSQDNEFTGIGVTEGSLRFQISSNSSDFIFNSAIDSVSSSEVFRIKGTNEVQFMGDSQKYSIIGGGFNTNSLSLQSQNSSSDFSFDIFTKDGDSTDSSNIKIFGLGNPGFILDSEYVSLGWDSLKLSYIFSSNYTGVGVNRNIILQSGIPNQLMVCPNGSTVLSSTLSSTNSTSGALIIYGGVSINSTVIASSITHGGALTINGGLSIVKNVFIGTVLNIGSSNGNISLYSPDTRGTLLIISPNSSFVFSGNTLSNTNMSIYNYNNNTSSNYSLLNSSFNGVNWNINSNAGGNGTLSSLEINVGNFSQLFLNTNGNIGINTTMPTSSLDINGNLKSTEYSYINGLGIYNTNDALNSVSTGSLYVSGGTTIDKSMRVLGLVSILNTTQSTSTQAALTISGGVCIKSNQTSSYGEGALTVNGGGYFGGDLYIEQDLNVNGRINGSSSSSTFAYLTLTGTNESLNKTTGTLITFGGITISCSSNSSSLNNGGSFLTVGGASIGKDVYIGGDLFNSGVSSYYTNTNNFIDIYDISNIKRFSFNRNTITNNFSISRNDSLGAFVENTIDVSNNNGMTTFYNTSNSQSITSGSIITMGGITINGSKNASNLDNGGSLTVMGGASINKNLLIGGDSLFSSTTSSTDSNNGAVVISGGIGIGGNLNVLGNTIISGDLTIMGSTTSVLTTNSLIHDNVIVLNSGPSGSKDSGFIIERYQYDNNNATGDVISDSPYFTDILPNQSGMIGSQVKLSSNASQVDDFYIGWWIEITSGFSSNQVRKVIGYEGDTRIITISSDWNIQNPSNSDNVSLFNKPYVGIIYNEIKNRFDFGSTIKDQSTNILFTDTLPIYFSRADSSSTEISTSFTSGGIVAAGGISSYCTFDATGISAGGSLSIAGGAAIAKSLYIGNNAYIGDVNITPNISDKPSTITYIASNNISIPTDITDLIFPNTVWGFDIYLSVQIIATTNYYSNYHIRGVNKGSLWEIVNNYVGDQTITFNINNNGQVQYTNTNFGGFVSATFKYKVLTN